MANLFVEGGVLTLTAFISPYRADRDKAREIAGDAFIEVYVYCDLAICEERDPKGLYKKARAGEIKNFTGIDDPYEAPANPEIHLKTDEMTLEEEVNIILDYLAANGIIERRNSPRVAAV